MPKKRKCKDCGTSEKPLSNNRLCFDCAMKRVNKSAKQMRAKKGKYYQNYKAGMKKWLETI